MQPNDTNGVPRRLYACRPHGIWSLYVFLNFMVIGDGISGGCGSGYKPKHHFDEEKMNTKDGKLQQRNGPKPNKKQKKSRTTDGAVLFFVGVHSLLLAIPIVREFMLWMGAIDVSWQAIVYQLTRTDAICHVAIIPEGVRGIGKPLAAATSHPHAVALLPSWHAKQWGFLHRLFHMELDVDIIPVICPTETSLCHIWTGECAHGQQITDSYDTPFRPFSLVPGHNPRTLLGTVLSSIVRRANRSTPFALAIKNLRSVYGKDGQTNVYLIVQTRV
jgi:hypothetical protein